MDASKKIVSLDELAVIIEKEKSLGKKVVLSHGVFDLFHPGHMLHLKSAKAQGDILVVTLTRDEYVKKGPGRPYFNQRLRCETVAAIEFVDYVAINEWPTAIETLKKLKPSYYAKGKDYADNEKDITGNIFHEVDAVRSSGGEIIYTDDEMFSSSYLLNRFFQNYPAHITDYFERVRSKFSIDQIIDSLKNISDLKVLVIGEVILDQYHYCQALGKPPKDPIVSTKYLSNEDFAGGTFAIAKHLANFCKEVKLISYIGDDGHLDYFNSKLSQNIEFIPTITNNRPTVTKRRFVEQAFMTKMFEVQHFNDEDVDERTEQHLVDSFNTHVANCDLVIIADYGHGMMTHRLKEVVLSSDKYIALNTQSNSANMGFNPVTKYMRANYISIDEPEIRFASHSKYGSIDKIAHNIMNRLKTSHLMVSRGPNGSALFVKNGAVYETPALSSKIIDRTGAGDALFAITAPCLFKKVDPEIVGLIANCVGAMAVETVCNRSAIDPTTLFKFITYMLK